MSATQPVASTTTHWARRTRSWRGLRPTAGRSSAARVPRPLDVPRGNGQWNSRAACRRTATGWSSSAPTPVPTTTRRSFSFSTREPCGSARRSSSTAIWSFDALSPDGGLMYLVQYRDFRNPLDYRVRQYDVRGDVLRGGAIVDPDEPEEKMTGVPVSRATSPDGATVYTLYGGGEETFIHALHTEIGQADCIDLEMFGHGVNFYDLKLEIDPETRRRDRAARQAAGGDRRSGNARGPRLAGLRRRRRDRERWLGARRDPRQPAHGSPSEPSAPGLRLPRWSESWRCADGRARSHLDRARQSLSSDERRVGEAADPPRGREAPAVRAGAGARSPARLGGCVRGAVSPPLAAIAPCGVPGGRRRGRRRGHRAGSVPGCRPRARPLRSQSPVRSLAAPDHGQPRDRLRPSARAAARGRVDRRGRRHGRRPRRDLGRAAGWACASSSPITAP